MAPVYKYLGSWGLFFYSAAVSAGVLILRRRFFVFFLRKVSRRTALVLIIVIFALLVICFFVLYPAVNTVLSGSGSDRDDDLDIAVSSLLEARYPYYGQTYLGNNLTHFPGSIFLAAPFVAMGCGACQNIFWLAVFLALACIYLKDTRLALWIFSQMLIFSPVFMHEWLTGGDLIANNIYIICPVYLLFRTLKAKAVSGRGWKALLLSVLLGVGLSSRLNFLFILPLVLSALIQCFGVRTALRHTLTIILTFSAATLPFYLYDPQGFSPLYGQLNKLKMLHLYGIPALSIMFLVTAAVVSGLSFVRLRQGCVDLFRNCAYVQVVMVALLVGLYSIGKGRLDLDYAGYGLNFLFFGLLAFGAKTEKNKVFDK